MKIIEKSFSHEIGKKYNQVLQSKNQQDNAVHPQHLHRIRRSNQRILKSGQIKCQYGKVFFQFWGIVFLFDRTKI